MAAGRNQASHRGGRMLLLVLGDLVTVLRVELLVRAGPHQVIVATWPLLRLSRVTVVALMGFRRLFAYFQGWFVFKILTLNVLQIYLIPRCLTLLDIGQLPSTLPRRCFLRDVISIELPVAHGR